MTIWHRVAAALAIALFTCFSFTGAAAAQSASAVAPSTVPFSPAANSALWEKFQRLQQDTQLQELVERDMERSIAIRTQIQEEVDRAFNHTTTLLNVLLAVLTCLPVLAAIGIWFIRRSVLNQIVAETKKQLKEEVEKQLESDVAAELKLQSEAFQKKVEALVKAECQSQLADLQPLALAIQSSPELPESASTLQINPEEIVPPTGQPDPLPSANDHVEKGREFHTKGSYEDAIACYDQALQLAPDHLKAWFSRGNALVKLQRLEEAIAAYDQVTQLKPDIPDGWFGKARGYALLGKPDPAIASLQQALQFNGDRLKDILKTDSAFDAIRNDNRYKALLG